MEESWDKLASNLLAARDACIPTYTASNKPTWASKHAYSVDEDTRKLIRKKAQAHNLFMEHKDKPDAELYRKSFTRARNHVRTVLRKKRRLYENEIASSAKSNPKKFYAYCQSKTRTKSGISPLLSDPNDKSSTVTSDGDKAEVLQAQYCSVFTDEDDSPLPNFEPRCNDQVPKIKVDIAKLHKKLATLDTAKAAGPDGIHPRLLRECADVIVEPLAQLYQLSLDTGEVPSSWKESVISPIFKKGARSLASNYRPVALTSILCKLLESIIREDLVKHLLEHNLLTNKQFGFIKGRSTQLQLLTFLDKIATSLAEGYPSPPPQSIDAIYLDYQIWSRKRSIRCRSAASSSS